MDRSKVAGHGCTCSSHKLSDAVVVTLSALSGDVPPPFSKLVASSDPVRFAAIFNVVFCVLQFSTKMDKRINIPVVTVIEKMDYYYLFPIRRARVEMNGNGGEW
jgi:hypothetical protein